MAVFIQIDFIRCSIICSILFFEVLNADQETMVFLIFLLLSSECLTQRSDDKVNICLTNFFKYTPLPSSILVFYCKNESLTKSYQFLFMPPELLNMSNKACFRKLQCPGSQDVQNKGRKIGLLHKTNTWIFYGKLRLKKVCCLKMGNVSYLMLTDRTEMPTKSTKTLDHFLQKIFSWLLKEEKLLWKRDNSISRWPNLMSEPIRASYALLYNRSRAHLTDYRYPQEDMATKLPFILINLICELFNASHVPIFRSHWGVYDKNTDSFSPKTMYWDIQHGLADISGNVGAMTQDRIRHFRFVAPSGNFFPNKLKWFFRAPLLSSTQNIWMLTFSKELWCVILGVVLLWYVGLAGIAVWETEIRQQNRFNELNCWLVALDVMIATVTQRGSNVSFTLMSGKLLSFPLFMLFVLLNTGFTANFLVLLQSTGNDIDDFNELLSHGIRLGSIHESYNYYYFMYPNDLMEESIRRKITARIDGQRQFWFNVSEGMELVKDGSIAYHVPLITGYNEMANSYDETDKRSIRTVDSTIQFKWYLCVAKNSTLDDFFSIGFLFLLERGLMRREQLKFLSQKHISDNSMPLFGSIDVRDLRFLLYIITLGALVSVSIFFLEIVTYYLIEN